MKKWFILLFGAVTASASQTLAVLDFENNSFHRPQEYQPLSHGLAEILITELQQIPSMQIVERRNLRDVLDELKLNQSGLVGHEQSIQAGKMLGAGHLVFGSFMVTLEEKIRIDVRIVEVETGLTLKSQEVTGKTREVLSLIQRLGKQLLKDLDIRLTKSQERLFDTDRKILMEALVQFSMGIEHEDQDRLQEARACYEQALNLDPKFELARTRLIRIDESLKKK